MFYYNGKKLGDGDFYICNDTLLICKDELTEAVIPHGVTKIGGKDFYFGNPFINCKNLRSITISDSVTEIHDNAFISCDNLSEIIVEEGNPCFVSVDNVLYSKDMKKIISYPQKKGGKSYTIPDGVTEIGFGAFIGCSSLEEIILPDGMTKIGSNAFMDCSGLKKIFLPKSVDEICSSVFSTCSNLSEITVDGNNPHFASVDNVLYTKDMKKILCYPQKKSGKSYTISNGPDGVTEIGCRAFIDCSSLEEIILPDGVTVIGDDAFVDCSNLKKIILPNSVTEIGAGAFMGCSSLKEIILPNSVSLIGVGAFSGCASLKEITLPDGVTEIICDTFKGCSSLKRITLQRQLV